MKSNLKTLTLFASVLLFACSPQHDDDHAGDDHASESGGEHDDHGDDHDDEGGDGHDDHGGHDEHEGEEGHVELTQEQYDTAGIETTAARSGQASEMITLAGSIISNANTTRHATPRVSGQLTQVLKNLGDSVQVGEVLCTFDSVELGEAVAAYLQERAQAAAATETLNREKDLFKGRISALIELTDGAIAIHQSIYNREEDLQKKAISTVRPLLEARKALELTKLAKNQQLTELRAARDTRVMNLEVAVLVEEIARTAARNRLLALGIPDATIEGLSAESPLLTGTYELRATGAGIITSRHATSGEFVAAGSQVFVIENPETLWFQASAFENQLRWIRNGQAADIELDAFPDAEIEATIELVDYTLDTASRSVGLRIVLANSIPGSTQALPLRPGMFGRAQISTSSHSAAVMIPESALIHDDAGDSVFVQEEPLGFEKRPVTIKRAGYGMVEVLSGLEAGEMVAIKGNFLLKSAERQGELGAGHSH
ncbi:MAG: efflux RND transporter periplasmic adaptor subunit [Planctomycetes bacterium]|nr:efflux RND transporter periplasmic adaptor subunit [Planctomycetota bacterium]